jgi:hypothetical protein
MAQLEQLILKAEGLYTFSNTFSEDTAPAGSMAIARNVVIDKDGIVSPRRGFEKLAFTPTGLASSNILKSFTTYKGLAIAHDAFNSALRAMTGVIDSQTPNVSWSLTGVSKPSDAVSVKFAQANKNLYFTTAQGVQKIDSITATPTLFDAGVPPAVGFATQFDSGQGTAVKGRNTTGVQLALNNTLVNFGASYFDATPPPFANGNIIRFDIISGVLPTPLAANTDYYVVGVTGSSFQVSLTSGGSPIVFGPANVGTYTAYRMDYAFHQVAYRVVWGRRDANNNLLLGAPSAPQVVQNTNTQTKDVQFRIYVPKRINTPDYFCRIYRTKGVATENTGIANPVDPGDEMNLCAEIPLTSGMITAGYIDYSAAIDVTPDELLAGASLYTNATQEGIASSNYQPPQCVDLAFYQNHMFYGNTQQTYNYTLTLISVDPSVGLKQDDQVVISYGVTTVTYTAKNSVAGGYDASTRQFEISADSNPFVAVETTAKNLVAVINADNAVSAEPFYALYDVQANDPPGKIKIIETDFGTASNFTVKIVYTSPTTRETTTFSPPLTHNVAYASSNETFTNRIYYSKLQEPEAVPVANYFDIGSTDDVIKRLIPLKNQLVVMTDKAIYAIIGTDVNSFSPVLLDNTTRLLAPDSAVSLSNQVYALFDQGIGRISSKTVEIVSRPIEGDLLRIRGEVEDDITNFTFGIPYESDRKYLLFLRSSSESGASKADLAYVFNTATSTWTTFDLDATAGYIGANDKLLIADGDHITRERKNFNDLDITGEDLEFSVTGMDVEGSIIYTKASSPSTTWPKVGDMVYRYGYVNNKYIPVSSVTPASNSMYILGHGLSANTKIRFSTVGTLPAPLVPYTDYYAIVVDANNFKVSATNGGPEIDITDQGTGQHKAHYIQGESFIYTKVASVNLENDIVGHGPSTQYVIRLIDDITLPLSFNYPTVQYRQAIDVEIEYNPISAGHPGILKQWSEAMLITRKSMENFTLAFNSGNSLNFDAISFTGQAVGGWGLFAWGDVPWGGEQTTLRYRTYIPRDKQRDPFLSIHIEQATSGNNFEIAGIQLMYRNISSKVVR